MIENHTKEAVKELDEFKKYLLTQVGILVQGEAVRNLSKPRTHRGGGQFPTYDTGNLANSITYVVDEDKVQIGTPVEYAIYIEKGTKAHWTSVKNLTDWVRRKFKGMNEKEQFFNMLGIDDNTGINNNGNMMPTTSEYNPMNGIIPGQGGGPDMEVDSFFNSLGNEQPNKQKQTKFTEHPLEWTAKRMGGGGAGMIGSLGHAITWLDNDNEIGAKMGAWGDKKAEKLIS